MNNKIKFKICLIGDLNVGKSNLNFRIFNGSFKEERGRSVSSGGFWDITIQIDKVFVTLQIWDPSGYEKFGSMTPTYYRGAEGIVLVYSVDDLESFQHVKKWFEESKQYSQENAVIYLIGNKCDAEDNQRVVSFEEGKALADSLGISFIETSAKNNINITEVFTSLSFDIMMNKNIIFLDSKPKQENAVQNKTENNQSLCLLL